MNVVEATLRKGYGLFGGGVQNYARTIALQALNIFHTVCAAAVVNSNAEALRIYTANASLLLARCCE